VTGGHGLQRTSARKRLILLDHNLRLPAGQTEKRDGTGQESGRFGAFQWHAIRSTDHQNLTPRENFTQEKGPGEIPSPCIWWSWRELNPRPQAIFVQFYMCSRLI